MKIILVVLALCQLSYVLCKMGKTEQMLDRILADYDKHQRPEGADGPPTKVKLHIHVQEAFLHENELTSNMILSQVWTDSRLKFEDPHSPLKLKAKDIKDRIWNPDTFLLYAHEVDPLMKGVVKLFNNGTVKRSRQLRVITYIPDAGRDKINSSYALTDFRYTDREVDLEWKTPDCFTVDKDASAKFTGIHCSKSKEHFTSGDYDHMVVQFLFEHPGNGHHHKGTKMPH